LNDIPIMLSQSHVSSVLYDRTMDYVDAIYEEGKDNVRVMSGKSTLPIRIDHPNAGGAQPSDLEPLKRSNV